MTENNNETAGGLTKSGDKFADAPLTDKIGKNLKMIYDDVLSEDIPDDFLALLQKADTQDN